MDPNFTLQDVIRAQGLALAYVGTILERDGLVEPGQFGRQLAVFATVTAERDEAEGTILAAWAGMCIDVSDAIRDGRPLEDNDD